MTNTHDKREKCKSGKSLKISGDNIEKGARMEINKEEILSTYKKKLVEKIKIMEGKIEASTKEQRMWLRGFNYALDYIINLIEKE